MDNLLIQSRCRLWSYRQCKEDANANKVNKMMLRETR